MHHFGGQYLLIGIDTLFGKIPSILSSKVVFAITERGISLVKLLCLIANSNLIETTFPLPHNSITEDLRALVASVTLLTVILGVQFEVVDDVVHHVFALFVIATPVAAFRVYVYYQVVSVNRRLVLCRF